MTEIRAWWAVRSLREKRLLLVMLALLAAAIVWFGLLRPLSDALSDARRRQADAAVLLGETEARASAARSLSGIGSTGAATVSGPLDADIRTRADQAGFVLGSVNLLDAARVRVTIAQARPAALFAWIAGLEQAGLLVEALNATDNGDRTVAVELTLRARRA